MSRELLARAWAGGAGASGDAPFTIDLDSTICETYGLAKEGARHHGYTGKRGYHPLGTGDGCATPGPTDDSRYGPTAGSTLMAWYPSAARWMSASPSPSASTRACAISSRRYQRMPGLPFPTGWTAPPMWPACTPFQSEPDAAPVRLIVRRVKRVPSWPSSTAITASSPTEDARTGGRLPPRDRECHPRPQARCGVEPSPLGPLRRQRRLAGGTGVAHRPLDSAHRSGRAGTQSLG